MAFPRKLLVFAFLVLIPAQKSHSQHTITAYRAPNGEITADGNLDEGVWSHLLANYSKVTLSGANSGDIFTGSFSGASDFNGKYVIAWDDSAVYIAHWLYDDVHHAEKSKSISTVKDAYEDDGCEYHVNIDFTDAWSDRTVPYRGTKGIECVKGYATTSGGAISNVYAGIWGGYNLASGHGLTYDQWGGCGYPKATWDSLGWSCEYATNDGINFTSETQYTWAGHFMQKIGAVQEDHEMAVDLLMFDNDDTGTASAEGSLKTNADYGHNSGGQLPPLEQGGFERNHAHQRQAGSQGNPRRPTVQTPCQLRCFGPQNQKPGNERSRAHCCHGDRGWPSEATQRPSVTIPVLFSLSRISRFGFRAFLKFPRSFRGIIYFMISRQRSEDAVCRRHHPSLQPFPQHR